MKKYDIEIEGVYLITVEAETDEEALDKAVKYDRTSETFHADRFHIIDEEEI